MTTDPLGHARLAVRAAAEAAALRDAFDAVLRLTPSPLLVVDSATGAVERANEAAWQALGVPPGTAATLVVRRPVHGGEGRRIASGRQLLLVDDDTLPVDLEVVPLRDAAGDETRALVRIATVRTTSQAEGRAVALLEELTRGLSVDVGAELTLAGGHAEVIARSHDPIAVLQAAEAVREHTGRATARLSQVVARARALLGGTGPTDLRELVAGIRELLAHALPADRLDVQLAPSPVGMPALDADVLRQVLLNVLLELARDPDGLDRTIRVLLEVERRGPAIAVLLQHDGPAVLPGAARAVAACGQLVAEAGGTWRVDQRGVEISLPVLEHHGSAAPPPVDVVVVDDDPDLVALVERVLRSGPGNFRLVGSSPTLAGATELVAALRPGVVLLDQDLPDGTGADAVQRLRDLSPDSVFVVLSGTEPHGVDAASDVPWLDKFRSLATLPATLGELVRLP